MVTVAFHIEGHSQDSIFQTENLVHAFYPTRGYRCVKEALTQLGCSVHTADIFKGKGVEPEIDVFFEAQPFECLSKCSVLIAMENPQINPLNKDVDYLRQFSSVLSWNTSLSHLNNFQLLSYSPLESISPTPSTQEVRSVFSTMICSNKVFKGVVEGDLYSKRVDVINWFEHNAVEDLFLYGLGWHKPPHERSVLGKMSRSLQRLKSRLTRSPCFRTWRGPLASKKVALSEAWFCFCFENTSSLPGYITEKMLDALAVGCIPVYFGAPDVCEYVPPNVFIDARQFKSIEALIAHLRSIPIESRIRMLHDGHLFISKSKQFSFEANVEVVVNAIISACRGRH